VEEGAGWELDGGWESTTRDEVKNAECKLQNANCRSQNGEVAGGTLSNLHSSFFILQFSFCILPSSSVPSVPSVSPWFVKTYIFL